MPNSEEDRAL